MPSPSPCFHYFCCCFFSSFTFPFPLISPLSLRGKKNSDLSLPSCVARLTIPTLPALSFPITYLKRNMRTHTLSLSSFLFLQEKGSLIWSPLPLTHRQRVLRQQKENILWREEKEDLNLRAALKYIYIDTFNGALAPLNVSLVVKCGVPALA